MTDTEKEPSTILDRLNGVMNVKDEPEQLPVPVADKKLEDDFNFAREKMQNIVKIGEAAIEDLSVICGELENPVEAYDSLSKLISVTSDAIQGTMQINLDKQEIANSKVKPATGLEKPTMIQQNNFIGTTSQAIDLIDQEDAIDAEAEEIEE